MLLISDDALDELYRYDYDDDDIPEEDEDEDIFKWIE